MKLLILIMIISSSFVVHAETVLKCTVNKVEGYEGARINLNRSSNGQLRANFIQGTTVSGTMYQVKEVSQGLYIGQIKNRPEFTIKLKVSNRTQSNQYVNGHSSELEVVYPTVLDKSGRGYFKSSRSDEFVCGKKLIGRF